MKTSFDLVDLLKEPQGQISGWHLPQSYSRSYNIQLSHKSLALTENAFGCYISGVGWSSNRGGPPFGRHQNANV